MESLLLCASEDPARRFGSAGHHVHESVTNAAGPGNDLLMMVSDEDLLVASVRDEEAFAAFYRRNARPLAWFSCGAPAPPSWRPI